jgi:hypothetical protein
VSLYLDASAILPNLVNEPSSATVTAILSAADEDLIVSEFAAAEVASGLSRLTRARDLSREKANELLAEFDAWRVAFTTDLDLQTADFRLASALVRRFELGLRAPDALHLAACRRGDHTLLTLDRRLAGAAETLGVRVTCLAA